MRSTRTRAICILLSLTVLFGLSGCAGGNAPEILVSADTTTPTDTTATEVEQTQLTQSDPIETTAQETTSPTETVTLETQLQVTEPPATEPPVTQSPVTQPTPTTPRVTELAQVEYEYGNHYVLVLNYTPAPDEHGHIYRNEDGAAKYYHAAYSFDVDFKTITYEIWCSWNLLTQMAFRSSQTCPYVTDYKMTPDENYYFDCVTIREDYACGFEGHYSKSQDGHEHFMEILANGCHYCAQSDCPSFYARNEWGNNETDRYLCPEYDIYRDSDFYCQDCGRPTHRINPDRMPHCFGYVHDMNCYYCGVWVEAFACHTCKQEDIDAFEASQGG